MPEHQCPYPYYCEICLINTAPPPRDTNLDDAQSVSFGPQEDE